MAKDAPKDEAEVEEAPKKKPRGKLFLIIGIVLALAGIGGGAGWYLTQGEVKPGEAKVAAQKEDDHKPPVFVPLEVFTVNLQADGGNDHILQVAMDLKVGDEKVVEEVKAHMPEVRNGVLLLLSGKTAEQIGNQEGKQKLSAEILEQVNKPLNVKEAGKGVTGVYFTSFVIQ